MTIPREHRQAFFSYMEVRDNTRLSVDAWMHAMLAAAEEFLHTHGIDEEPRAAVVYYIKRLDLGEDAD